jgi:nucleotide-binding universal stress UspA family protein
VEVKIMVEFKRILVPLDGSPLAEKALPVAMSLAQRFDGQIILLRVVDFPVLVTPVMYPEIPPSQLVEIRDQARQEAEAYLKARQDELSRQGFDVRIFLGETSPAEHIINTADAEEVDLIVMSTHGRGGLARWALGSVADRVIRHGPCPVLLIRQKLEVEAEQVEKT